MPLLEYNPVWQFDIILFSEYVLSSDLSMFKFPTKMHCNGQSEQSVRVKGLHILVGQTLGYGDPKPSRSVNTKCVYNNNHLYHNKVKILAFVMGQNTQSSDWVRYRTPSPRMVSWILLLYLSFSQSNQQQMAEYWIIYC